MVANKVFSYWSDPAVGEVPKSALCIVWVLGVDQQVWIWLRIVFIERLVIECPGCNSCHVIRADVANFVFGHVVTNVASVVLCVHLPKYLSVVISRKLFSRLCDPGEERKSLTSRSLPAAICSRPTPPGCPVKFVTSYRLPLYATTTLPASHILASSSKV